MDEYRGGEGPAGEHAEPAARGLVGTERTAAGVLVETGALPDGRAIRFFSWAPDTEWASIMVNRATREPSAPTRRAPGAPVITGDDESRVTDTQCLQRDSADNTGPGADR